MTFFEFHTQIFMFMVSMDLKFECEIFLNAFSESGQNQKKDYIINA
jgi:hypothetical protein